MNVVVGKGGVYVEKGNGKKIEGWKELKRGDMGMMKREKGCGGRVVVDEEVGLVGVNGGDVVGYGDMVSDD